MRAHVYSRPCPPGGVRQATHNHCCWLGTLKFEASNAELQAAPHPSCGSSGPASDSLCQSADLPSHATKRFSIHLPQPGSFLASTQRKTQHQQHQKQVHRQTNQSYSDKTRAASGQTAVFHKHQALPTSCAFKLGHAHYTAAMPRSGEDVRGLLRFGWVPCIFWKAVSSKIPPSSSEVCASSWPPASRVRYLQNENAGHPTTVRRAASDAGRSSQSGTTG